VHIKQNLTSTEYSDNKSFDRNVRTITNFLKYTELLKRHKLENMMRSAQKTQQNLWNMTRDELVGVLETDC